MTSTRWTPWRFWTVAPSLLAKVGWRAAGGLVLRPAATGTRATTALGRCWSVGAAVAACVAAMAPAAAADLPEVVVREYGEYAVQREDELPGMPAGSSGVTGRVSSVGARLLHRTARIEAGPCRRFGAWFQPRHPLPDGILPITARLTHPVMVRPDGRSGTVESDAGFLGDEPMLSGFSFTFDWEMVPGTWTFAVLSGDKVLAEQVFEVLGPSAGTIMPSGGCDAPVS